MNESQFRIETRDAKSKKWVLKYLVDRNLSAAQGWYNAVNLGPGFAKRLVQVQGQDRKVLLRSFGY